MQSDEKLHRYPETIRTAWASRSGRGIGIWEIPAIKRMPFWKNATRIHLHGNLSLEQHLLSPFYAATCWTFQLAISPALLAQFSSTTSSFSLSLSLSFSLTHTRMPDSFEYLLFLANTRLWPVTSFLVRGNKTSYANKFEKLNRPSQGSEKFWMISKEYIQHYLWQT